MRSSSSVTTSTVSVFSSPSLPPSAVCPPAPARTMGHGTAPNPALEPPPTRFPTPFPQYSAPLTRFFGTPYLGGHSLSVESSTATAPLLIKSAPGREPIAIKDDRNETKTTVTSMITALDGQPSGSLNLRLSSPLLSLAASSSLSAAVGDSVTVAPAGWADTTKVGYNMTVGWESVGANYGTAKGVGVIDLGFRHHAFAVSERIAANEQRQKMEINISHGDDNYAIGGQVAVGMSTSAGASSKLDVPVDVRLPARGSSWLSALVPANTAIALEDYNIGGSFKYGNTDFSLVTKSRLCHLTFGAVSRLSADQRVGVIFEGDLFGATMSQTGLVNRSISVGSEYRINQDVSVNSKVRLPDGQWAASLQWAPVRDGKASPLTMGFLFKSNDKNVGKIDFGGLSVTYAP